jgi:hypothetical protein
MRPGGLPHSHVPGAKVSVRSLARDEVSEDRPFAGAAAAERAHALHSLVSVARHPLAGQAMNRYRGTHAEFQFSTVANGASEAVDSRASECSLRS